MFRSRELALIGVVLAFICHNAIAAVVYDEDIDGDIPSGPGPTIGFSLGVNTIIGHASFDVITTPFSSDFDYYDFTIPANSFVSNVVYSYSVVANEGNSTFRTVVHLKEKSLNFNSSHPTVISIVSGSGTQNISLTGLPLVELYQWKEEYQSSNLPQERVFWDYSTSYTIAAVPLPASMFLFLSGLIGILLFSPIVKKGAQTHTVNCAA